MEFREELPKTIVGKVLRRALREEEERKAGRRKNRQAGQKNAASADASPRREVPTERTPREGA